MAYSSVSISGYNASPPSDDGSQVESNRVDWSKIKEKLTDPLKTAIESINTQNATEFSSIASNYLGNSDIVHFQAYNASQNLTDNTWTKLQVGTVDYESAHDDYDETTNYRFTPTEAGDYLCWAQCKVDPSGNAAGDQFSLRFYKNGSGILYSSQFYNGASDFPVITLNKTALVSFNGTSDYLELYGYHTNTGTSEEFDNQIFGAIRMTTA